MKIYCNSCNNIFPVECLKKKVFVDGETHFCQRQFCCPFCFSKNLSPIKICKRCGEIFTGDELFCKECIGTLKKEFFEFLKKYSVDEQEVMLCE